MSSAGFFGAAQQPYPFQFNAPSTQMSHLQQLLGPLLGSMLPQMLSGQLNNLMASPQNFYDQQRSLQHNLALQKMAGMGAEQDINQLSRIANGFGQAWMGRPLSAEEQQTIHSGLQAIGPSVIPMLANYAPQTLDNMMGMRGSSTVFSQEFGNASHFFRTKDGRSFSGEDAAKLMGETFDQLGGRVGGAEAGQTLRELQKRGRMENMSGDTLIDSSRIANSIKDANKSVQAMREIFGDAGHPDAPIAQLFNSLDMLTQGSMARYGPDKAAHLVRMVREGSRTSGLGIDAIGILNSQIAGMADQLGLDRSLVLPTGIHAVNSMTGMRRAGAFDTQAFGQLSQDQMASLQGQLSTQAAASPVANMLSATARLSERGALKEGSEGAALAAAIKAGNSTYEYGGKTHSTTGIQPQRWNQIMQQSGVDTRTANMTLSQYSTNQASQTQEIQALTADAQGKDVVNLMASQFSLAIGNELPGTDRDKMDQISREIINYVMSLDGKEIDSEPKLIAAVLPKAREIMKKYGVKVDDATLKDIISLGFGELNAMAGKGGDPRMAGYKSFFGVHQAHGKASVDQRRQATAEAKEVVKSQQAAADNAKSQANLTKQGIEFVAAANEGTTLGDAAGAAAGMIGADETTKTMTPRLEALDKEIAALAGKKNRTPEEESALKAKQAEREKVAGLVNEAALKAKKSKEDLVNAGIKGVKEGGEYVYKQSKEMWDSVWTPGAKPKTDPKPAEKPTAGADSKAEKDKIVGPTEIKLTGTLNLTNGEIVAGGTGRGKTEVKQKG